MIYKSFLKKLSFGLMAALFLTSALPMQAGAAEPKAADTSAAVENAKAVDFNSYTSDLSIDYTQATQLPLTGYFTKTVGDMGRSVKVYISANAPTRSKFTVIAVPNGVDTYAFLSQQGWISLADRNGECLFALEPGKNGWGTQEAERDYVNKALTFLTSGMNDHKIAVFTTFGTFCLVGYSTGCAPLEAWAAESPIFVCSQAYVGGTTVGQSYLDKVGAETYDGHNSGGYDPGMDDAEFTQTLQQLGGDGKFITRSDVPVPTWLAGYSRNSYSVSYWKAANDVLPNPVNNIYYQDVNSNAWQTRFANETILKNTANAVYGISQVKVTSSQNLKASDLYAFLSNYIRYTTTFAYSNHLEYRLNYGPMIVDLQKGAAASSKKSGTYPTQNGKTGTYESWAQSTIQVQSPFKSAGTLIGGVAALADYNKDGKLDPRDYLIYIPDSAKTLWKTSGAPVIIVHPGMTQTASVFMDCSMWWQVANEEGCVIAIVGEVYSNAVAVTYPEDIAQSADYDYMLEQIVRDSVPKYVKINSSRFYAAGHSLGSKTVQTLAQTNPDLFAAAASTSFESIGEVSGTGEQFPTYLIHGQSDLPFEMPDLWGNTDLQTWLQAFLKADGIKTDINGFSASNTIGRFHTYVWRNAQNIPMVQYGYTLAREHNCMPDETRLEWGYLKHFSFKKNPGKSVTARFYSESGYKIGDSIQIKKG